MAVSGSIRRTLLHLIAASLPLPKKRILPHHAPLPFFFYCLANNQGSYSKKSLQPGKVSLFCALAEGFIRVDSGCNNIHYWDDARRIA